MTSEEILAQLDHAAESWSFPMLDNGYAYPADVRLTAYRDASRWALIIETVNQSPRGGGHGGTCDVLHVFGNCIHGEPGPTNDDFISRTGDPPEGEVYSEECDWVLNTHAGMIRIREVLVPYDLGEEVMKRKGIIPAEQGRLSAIDLLRSLLPEHRALFLANEEEKRTRLPIDLPEILCLDEWHHPDLAGGELPSGSETFQMLAEVLRTGEIELYKPSKAPNTHWRNWPDGGAL